MQYHPVIHFPANYQVLDLRQKQYHRSFNSSLFTIGRYNEKRIGMYTASQFAKENRFIHMGIDFGAPAGTPIFAFADGVVAYKNNNRQLQDYGPTLVFRHIIEGEKIFALYGHLSCSSLILNEIGQSIRAGQLLGFVGDTDINGGWPPHLHFQISTIDPKKADMPGAVSLQQHRAALRIYPDPRKFLGPIY